MNSEPPNATKPDTCPTVFVPDLPSQRDSFENNKAYKRIVSAIVDIVGSSTNDGMSIGVEGSWGAGKTTIINLLREELLNSSNPEIRLIAFDAWAHEGDPLRLTFLETLKEGLVPEGWVNKNKWNEQLDIISGRKDITDTASDYGLTWLDYIIASSFFLIPVGVAVLQDALRNGVTFDSSQPVAWQLLLGLLLCLATPLLVLGKILQKRMKSRADASEGTFQASKQWSLALLLNRTLTAGRTVVVKTPEPTSTEFEKKFKELMGDALSNDQQRRIVLVIDNLDRVQPAQAVAIWSTLQTFLQHRHHNPPKWLKQLYTIVLYDPKRISDQPSESDQNTNSDTLAGLIARRQPEQQQSEDSFLDKSFQIRLEVPPPILSDWRSYLLELLSKALPLHTRSELHDVYRVLAVERQSNPPSIRELKVYVNQICALHLQWQDSFRLSHLAYYVRLKRRREDIVAGLVKGTYPQAEYSGILGESVPDSLASLSFNVEPKIAYQILMRNPIQDALAHSSGTELKNLAERAENGFWEALENVVSEDWAAGQSEKAAVGIVAIERSGVLKESQRTEAGSVRNTLTRIALALKSWKPLDPTMAEAISIVSEWSRLTNSNEEKVKRRTEQLVEAIAEGLFDRDPMRKSTIAVPRWLSSLNVLIQRNQSLGLPDVDYITTIVSKISDRLKNADYVQAEEISRLLEVLIQLEFKEPIAGDALRALAGGGHILNYFNYVHVSSRDHASCAWCILTILCFAPSIDGPPNTGNVNAYNAFLELSKKENVQDVQEFSALLIRYKDTLTSVALDRGDVLKDFLSQCLKNIASGPQAESFFTGPFVLRNWIVFSRMISEWKKDVLGFSRIRELLTQNAELIQEIQRRGFQKEEAGLYRLLIENEKAETSEFRNWCGANLEQLTKTDWKLDMEGSRALVYLASTLRENGTPVHPGEPYQTAVLTTIEHLLNDTDPFVLLVDMGFVLTPLGDDDRHAVCNKVYERIQFANGDVPPGFFSSIGKIIFHALRIDRRSLSSILKPIIENRDESDLKWLTRVVLKRPSLVKGHADSEVVSDFRKMVLEASKASDSATPLLHELAAAIDHAVDERGENPWI